MIEDTLVVLKPDTLLRGLVGNIMDRFEKVGLKLVACKMTQADEKIIEKMYDISNRQWVEMAGEKSVRAYRELGLDIVKEMGTDDPYKIGVDVVNNLKAYMLMSPVIVMIWEGVNAISVARKLRGDTTPFTAEKGTITGDLSHDSPMSANLNNRVVRNLVHASGDVNEANREISLWFGLDFEPMEYDRSDAIFF